MNCRSCQRQVADWKSGRLPVGRSRSVAAHIQTCAACAEEARAEARMCAAWSVPVEAQTDTDLWPRVAAHLEANAAGLRSLNVRRRPWVLVGATGLAVLTAFGLCLVPRGDAPPPQAAAPPPQAAAPVASLERSAALPVLPDVARVDPAVDDPAGNNMEKVWILINTSRDADSR